MELKKNHSQTFKLKSVEVNPNFNYRDALKSRQACISMNYFQMNKLTQLNRKERLIEDVPQPSDHSRKEDGQNFRRASSCIKIAKFTDTISPIPIILDLEQELPEVPNVAIETYLPQELPVELILTNHTSHSNSKVLALDSVYRKKLIETPSKMKHIKSSSYVSTAANITKSEFEDSNKKYSNDMNFLKTSAYNTEASSKASKTNFNSRNQTNTFKSAISKQEETLTNPEFVSTIMCKKSCEEKSVRVIKELDSYTTNSRDFSCLSKSFFYENSYIFRDLICRGKHLQSTPDRTENSKKQKPVKVQSESKKMKSLSKSKFNSLDLDQYLVHYIKVNSLRVVGDAVTYDEKLFAFYLDYLDFLTKQYSVTAFKLIKQRLDRKMFGSIKYIKAINSTIKFTIAKLLQVSNLKVNK